MGWTAVKNGKLLRLASEEFEVFVTVDRSLGFQQDVETFSVAIVVLRARTNRLADLEPLVPRLLHAIETASPGKLQMVAD